MLNVFGYDPARDGLAIRTLASVAPQENNLDDELNVYQNLYVYSKFYDLEKKEARRRIGELLEFMELHDRPTAKIRELSGGMKRRLLIARALLNQPRLLILDEPTTGLDPQVRHLIWEKLRQLRRQGITILLTTHYMEEAFQICDRILIMHQGREVMTGSPAELLARHIEPYVLEVHNPDRLASRLEALREGVRKEVVLGRLLLYARQWDLLQNVAASLPQGEYYLRQVNLEDLFLRATGSQLHEK
jgi:lipooligosaccharide transport system ATP-binding protein